MNGDSTRQVFCVDCRRSKKLTAEILRVNVDAGFSVVNKVPARMIRIFIDNYVVRTSPTPVGGIFPITWKDFKAEAAVEPEAMETEVKPREAIAVVRAKTGESTVLVGTIDVEARVISIIMAIPLIIADVGPLIDSSVLIGVILRLSSLGPSLRRRRNVASVSAVYLTP
jgi:hypothetical protein